MTSNQEITPREFPIDAPKRAVQNTCQYVRQTLMYNVHISETGKVEKYLYGCEYSSFNVRSGRLTEQEDRKTPCGRFRQTKESREATYEATS